MISRFRKKLSRLILPALLAVAVLGMFSLIMAQTLQFDEKMSKQPDSVGISSTSHVADWLIDGTIVIVKGGVSSFFAVRDVHLFILTGLLAAAGSYAITSLRSTQENLFPAIKNTIKIYLRI